MKGDLDAGVGACRESDVFLQDDVMKAIEAILQICDDVRLTAVMNDEDVFFGIITRTQ